MKLVYDYTSHVLPEVVFRLRNDLYCVEWGVKLYSLTHSPEVVYVWDFLHAKPAELGSTDSARHVVARTVVHLHYQSTATRTRLYVTCKTHASGHGDKAQNNMRHKLINADTGKPQPCTNAQCQMCVVTSWTLARLLKGNQATVITNRQQHTMVINTETNATKTDTNTSHQVYVTIHKKNIL